MDAFVERVRSALLDLWKMYVPPQSSVTSPPSSTPLSTKKVDEDTSAFHQYMAGTMGGTQTNAPGAELDLYLEERNVILTNDDTFDILSWWKGNSARFPSLSEFAKIILMIPMTSVASESAFSTGGRVLDDYRMRLNEESVEALLCAQDWMKTS